MKIRKTIVGKIDKTVLDFTVGDDPILDVALAEHDCVGTAAHVTMLSSLKTKKPLISKAEKAKVLKTLRGIVADIRAGKFEITQDDQDVHMAVERMLTDKLGQLGKKVHTARSRNDQVALDLRLYAREHLSSIVTDTLSLAESLLKFSVRHRNVPMVGRTHLQPAMPSSVGLWASAYLESLIDDLKVVKTAYDLNNRSPLGSAAGYGVPLKINRSMTAKLLGFDSPIHNVLYASNTRGKCESVIVSALLQIMLTLSRLAEDLILYSMPEFGYFKLPAQYCTGSSIMPQKSNPDVLELVRAKTSAVSGNLVTITGIINSLAGGYNRDLQEAKGPFMMSFRTVESSIKVMNLIISGLAIDRKRLLEGFTPPVFATDRALELVSGGMPFRDAYDKVKAELNSLSSIDPYKAVRLKNHEGAPAGLDFASYRKELAVLRKYFGKSLRNYSIAISKLIVVR